MMAIGQIYEVMKRVRVHLTFNNLAMIENNDFAVKKVICSCGFSKVPSKGMQS